MFTIIAAMDRNSVIGKNGKIPWHLPKEYKHFKETTEWSTVVMGMGTWLSLPKKPLPERDNYVLSSGEDNLEGATVISSIEVLDCSNAYIIGGGQVYARYIDVVDEMILTHIDVEIENGDTFFPEFDENEWIIETLLVSEPDKKNEYGFEVKKYIKRWECRKVPADFEKDACWGLIEAEGYDGALEILEDALKGSNGNCNKELKYNLMIDYIKEKEKE